MTTGGTECGVLRREVTDFSRVWLRGNINSQAGRLRHVAQPSRLRVPVSPNLPPLISQLLFLFLSRRLGLVRTVAGIDVGGGGADVFVFL